MIQDDLKLTPEQRHQVDDLQIQVDQSLAEILTDAQAKQFKEMSSRGPRGFGPPGGGRQRVLADANQTTPEEDSATGGRVKVHSFRAA